MLGVFGGDEVNGISLELIYPRSIFPLANFFINEAVDQHDINSQRHQVCRQSASGGTSAAGETYAPI